MHMYVLKIKGPYFVSKIGRLGSADSIRFRLVMMGLGSVNDLTMHPKLPWHGVIVEANPKRKGVNIP